MILKRLLLVLFVILFTNSTVTLRDKCDRAGACCPPKSNSHAEEYRYAEAIVGNKLLIGCGNLDRALITSIKWFKEKQLIYATHGLLETGKQKTWYHHEYFKDRIPHFGLRGSDNTTLVIPEISFSDEGNYTCLAIYNGSGETQSTRFYIAPIVPTTIPDIKINNKSINRIDCANGFKENDSLVAECFAGIGYPNPYVCWYRDGVKVLHTTGNEYRSILRVKLDRKDNFRKYKCVSSNSDVARPRISTLEMNICAPLQNIALVSVAAMPLMENFNHSFRCLSKGSVPPPIFQWGLDGATLFHGFEQRAMGETEVSTLTILLTQRDDAKLLWCRIFNPEYENQILFANLTLDIMFAPIVRTYFNGGSNETIALEGSYTGLHCNVKANPSPYRVRWLFVTKQGLNRTIVDHLRKYSGDGAGVPEQTLAMSNVSHLDAGYYFCQASNVHGDADSDSPLHLIVKHKPICTYLTPRVHKVTHLSPVFLPCLVDAHPPPIKYLWKFPNGTMISYTRLLKYNYFDKARIFGNFSCFSENEIGWQESACITTVKEGRLPNSPYNCSIFDLTPTSFVARCEEDLTGGIPDAYFTSLRDEMTRKIVKSKSSTHPKVAFGKLDPGHSYRVQISSRNSVGPSRNHCNFTLTTLLPQEEDMRLGFVLILVIVIVFVAIVSAMLYVQKRYKYFTPTILTTPLIAIRTNPLRDNDDVADPEGEVENETDLGPSGPTGPTELSGPRGPSGSSEPVEPSRSNKGEPTENNLIKVDVRAPTEPRTDKPMTCPEQDTFLFHAPITTNDDISENISEIIQLQYLNIPTEPLPPLLQETRLMEVNGTRNHLIGGLERRRELIRIIDNPVHVPD